MFAGLSWGALRGASWAWLSSRLVLIGVAWVGQTMRSGLYPRYPRPDLLCAGAPCHLGAFLPWVVPALAVLVGAIAMWGLVEARHGPDVARWVTWLWLCVPSALAFQFSAPLAWASAALLVASWQAARGKLWPALVALGAAVALLPAAGLGALFVAAALREARARGWWVALLGVVVAAALRDPVVGLIPSSLVGPSGLEVKGVQRMEFLEAVVLSVGLTALALGAKDRWLAVAALPLVALGAWLGVPWLGRVGALGPAWAVVGVALERRPVVRHAALGVLAMFQGLLLHFEIHRVPVL